MKFLAILQARCGSSRLPNKVLKDIYGKTVIERMLSRITRSKYVDEFVVATTINPEDIEIVHKVTGLGFRVFAGSSVDVLDRYYQTAKLIKPEYIIRLTADNPLLDWRLLDRAIESLDPKADDLAMCSETFPDGEDLEIIKFTTLEYMWKNACLASEREHVTLYIKNHPELFQIQDFKCESDYMKNERWTLDEEEDLQLIRAVYRNFLPNDDFSMEQIYDFLQNHKEIWLLNRKYTRNEGLKKSLQNDYIVKL